MASNLTLAPMEVDAHTSTMSGKFPRRGQGFWHRAGAYLLDFLLFVITSWLIACVAGLMVGLLAGLSGIRLRIDTQQFESYASLLSLGAFIFYYALSEWLGGTSPGKLLLGMRVVQRDGRPCGFGAALLRGVMRLVDSLFFCLPALLSMQEPLNQRLGDRVARTLVVRETSYGFTDPRPRWDVLVALALWMSGYGLSIVVLLLMAILD